MCVTEKYFYSSIKDIHALVSYFKSSSLSSFSNFFFVSETLPLKRELILSEPAVVEGLGSRGSKKGFVAEYCTRYTLLSDELLVYVDVPLVDELFVVDAILE
jgi:hypothetical protein